MLPFSLVYIFFSLLYYEKNSQTSKHTMLILYFLVSFKMHYDSTGCPSKNEWINIGWSVYTVKYYSVIKTNEIMTLQEDGWSWRSLC